MHPMVNLSPDGSDIDSAQSTFDPHHIQKPTEPDAHLAPLHHPSPPNNSPLRIHQTIDHSFPIIHPHSPSLSTNSVPATFPPTPINTTAPPSPPNHISDNLIPNTLNTLSPEQHHHPMSPRAANSYPTAPTSPTHRVLELSPITKRPRKRRQRAQLAKICSDLDLENEKRMTLTEPENASTKKRNGKKKGIGKSKNKTQGKGKEQLEESSQCMSISDGAFVACNRAAWNRGYDWEAEQIWAIGQRIGVIGKGKDEEIISRLIQLAERDRTRNG